MSNGPQLQVTDLIRDAGLNGNKEVCQIYVLDLITTINSSDVIGYAICYFSYSTWLGKCYFIEDLYVKPNYRQMGGGSYMLHEIANIAKQHQCKRIDFHVLEWNPARSFYAKHGAVDLTVTENWHLYRLNEQQIEKLYLEQLEYKEK